MPSTRTYRPEPETASVWVPPVLVLVEKIVVQLDALADTWIWYAVAYAASHCSRTWVTLAVAPRSTCSHCGSLNADDQRVPALPSTADAAGNVPAFSDDDAVAGFPCEIRGSAAAAVPTRPAGAPPRTTAAATAATNERRRIRLGRAVAPPPGARAVRLLRSITTSLPIGGMPAASPAIAGNAEVPQGMAGRRGSAGGEVRGYSDGSEVNSMLELWLASNPDAMPSRRPE